MQFLKLLLTCFLIINILSYVLTFSSTLVRSAIDLKTKINRFTLTHTKDEVNLYIASINHLYRLHDHKDPKVRRKTLEIKVDLITGPKSQKPRCAFLTSESSGSQCIKYICDEDSNSKILNTMNNRQQSQLVENENRLLLINDNSEEMIECGSIDYGGCRLRRLSDLSIIGCNYSAPLIPFSTASGVIVSTSNLHSVSSSSALYLMISMETDQSNSKLEKSEFPVFSFRNLDSHVTRSHTKPQLFQLKYPIEYMNYDQNLFDSQFHMKIKYSFKHNGYIYFLYTITNKILTQSCNKIVTQQANNQTDSIIVTRMVRICDTSWSGDESSRSANKRNNPQANLDRLNDHLTQTATNLAVLGELVIDCDDHIGNKYHLLQSAFFLDKDQDSTLFMTFNTTTSTKSAVCSVKLQKLEDHYSTMIRKCMDGDNSYAELLSPYSNKATWKAPCRCSMLTLWENMSPLDRIDDRKLFCHNDYFNYLNGRNPLTLKSIQIRDHNNLIFSKTITAISALHSNIQKSGSIVLVLATSDAKIVMSTYNQNKGIAYKYDQVDLIKSNAKFNPMYKSTKIKSSALDISLEIADDYQIFSNLTSQDSKDRSLYVTFDRFLFKLDLQNCQNFDTCDKCLGGEKNIGNPFCGWCVYTEKCSPHQECLHENSNLFNHVDPNHSSLWLNKVNYNSQCPKITESRPSKYFNPSVLYNNGDESIKFNLNLNLFQKTIDYFCDVNVNFNHFSARSFSYSTTLNRIKGIPNEKNELSCNLTMIKKKLQKFVRQVPIEAKLANLTVEIRAAESYKETLPQLTTLIATTTLYAFNCSYFKQCGQCLNPKLNSGCVWCAKNSKCVYNTKIENSINLFDYNYEETQCPNEIEFYRNRNSDVCTSFSTQNQSKPKIKLPLTADSELSKFTQLSIKHRRLSFQFKFKCVFTNTDIITNTTKLLGSNLIWPSNKNLDYNQNPFDCIFSPYMMKDIDTHAPIQKVYLSVWWSSRVDKNQLNSYLPSSTRSEQLDSLNGWNQIQFKTSESTNESEMFFKDDSLLNKNNFIHIDVVSCNVKAVSCGECMEQELIELGCGWCKSTSQCSMKKDCRSAWMNDLTQGYCANPLVKSMTPTCGPRNNGGTEIVLTGQNLGMSSNDVRVRFKAVNEASLGNSHTSSNDDLECDVIDRLYIKPSRIVCRTKSIANSKNNEHVDKFSVYVQTNTQKLQMGYSSFNMSNQFVFHYITPKVFSVQPQRGIKSGGTLLTITGKHLSCGSSIKFYMANGVCSIINITKSGDYDIAYCITPKYTNSEQLKSWNKRVGAYSLSSPFTAIQMKMDSYSTVLDERRLRFEYVNNPKILSIKPDRTIASGGLLMTIKGNDFENVQTAGLVLSAISPEMQNDMFEKNNELNKDCEVINSTVIECLLPEMNNDGSVSEYSVNVQFNQIEAKSSNFLHQINVFPDPIFKTDQIFTDKTRIILIEGDNLLLGVNEDDYTVWIGSIKKCNITSITMNLIACIPDIESIQLIEKDLEKKDHMSEITEIRRRKRELTRSKNFYDVQVQIGQTWIRRIGTLKLESDNRFSDSRQMKYIIFMASIVSLFLFSTIIGCFIILKRRQNKQIRQLKRMQNEFENLEMRVARECKEAFTELQMDIGELANTLNQTGAPFHDYQTYCMKILLPNASDAEKYCMTTSIDLRLSSANKDNVQRGVAMFSQLILNKNFLLTFIRTLESDTNTFLMQDRINLASFISICLHDRMDYFTDVLFTLLADLIHKTVETKNNPKILLRRNESVAEKMLANWFTFLLYDFIHNCAGTPLYILFLSIKQQIYKGPVDSITCEARYSLSEDKLIRQSIDYETIIIRVQLQDFDELKNHEVTVKVLNCDTITQAKEKILDAFFKGYPFSKRPSVEDLDLVYISSEIGKNNHGRLILHDEDKTCKIDSDESKRFNTLSHYKITNGSLLVLITRQSYQIINSNDGLNSYSILDNVNSRNAENMTLLSKSSKGSSSPPTYSKLSMGGLNEFTNGVGIYSAMNGSSVGLTENALLNNTNSSRVNNNYTLNNKSGAVHSTNQSKLKKYHLIKASDDYHSTTPNIKDDKSPKLMSEVYLTRLLATKGGMQSYVDDFFETVFSTAHGSNVLPYAVKYLYDFLDEQAMIHGISDPDVVYTWKSNSLPLRFWVNIIKNPDFVFDIHKSNIVDASLSVIASTFMDSCSQSRLDLNKESPSGKLLFYKEVHKYRKWVESYYSDIKQMPRINDQDLSEMLNEESRKHPGVFNKNNALYRLYNNYVKKYRTNIEASLNNENLDPHLVSINKHLNYRLQQVIYLMDAIEV